MRGQGGVSTDTGVLVCHPGRSLPLGRLGMISPSYRVWREVITYKPSVVHGVWQGITGDLIVQQAEEAQGKGREDVPATQPR